jgi:hypothetical protein
VSAYWTIPKLWHGETAFVIGGGPSGDSVDWEKLRGRKVIAVNSSFEKVPFADYLFFGDERWFRHNKAALANFAGRIVTPSVAANDSDWPKAKKLLRVRRRMPNTTNRRRPFGPGLDPHPNAVVSNRTSVQGAMNLAYHLGVYRIVLVAVDMGRAPDGRTHHHSPHPWKNKPGNLTWDGQLEQLGLIVQPLRERGIVVFNTSPVSRIPDSWGWQPASLESILET